MKGVGALSPLSTVAAMAGSGAIFRLGQCLFRGGDPNAIVAAERGAARSSQLRVEQRACRGRIVLAQQAIDLE